MSVDEEHVEREGLLPEEERKVEPGSRIERFQNFVVEQSLRITNEIVSRENAKKLLQFIYIYCGIIVPVCFAITVRLFILEEQLYMGEWAELIVMAYLYVPSILFFIFGPTCFREDYNTDFGSVALKFLIVVLGICFGIHEVSYLCPCFAHDNNWQGLLSSEEVMCSWRTICQRFLELLFFLGLTLFICCNRYYPRSNMIHLAYLAHLCSAVVYSYIMNFVFEEVYIYREILEHTHILPVTSEEEGNVLHRGFRIRQQPSAGMKCHGKFNCVLHEYLEMFYVAMGETLVVGISITIAMMFDVGREEQTADQNRSHHEEHHLPSDVGLQIFTEIHIFMLAVGVIACLPFLDGSEHISPPSRPIDMLDRNFMFFGTAGIFAFICVGTVHCAYLIPSSDPYPTKYAFSGLAVNLSSGAQVIIQTITILSRKLSSNLLCATVLRVVNFTMFALDLFDAATLGVYANPVPHGSNVGWTLLVRGLGPLNVFCRFHCLAFIAESIEHHFSQQAPAPVVNNQNGNEERQEGHRNDAYDVNRP